MSTYEWKQIPYIFPTDSVFTNVVTDSDGRYVYITTSKGVFYASNNYGINGSWSAHDFNHPNTESITGSLACSDDGRYVAVGLGGIKYDENNSSYLYYSSDYGLTFSTKISSDSKLKLRNVKMDSTGQNIFALFVQYNTRNTESELKYSSDGGNTFADLISNETLGYTVPNLYSIAYCNKSDYLYGIVNNGTNNDGDLNDGRLWISTDSGESWATANEINNINIESIVIPDDMGMYSLLDNLISNTYAASYDNLTANATNNSYPSQVGTCINTDGSHILSIVNNDGDKLYYSTDYGNTWYITNSFFNPIPYLFTFSDNGNRIYGVFYNAENVPLVYSAILTTV